MSTPFARKDDETRLPDWRVVLPQWINNKNPEKYKNALWGEELLRRTVEAIVTRLEEPEIREQFFGRKIKIYLPKDTPENVFNDRQEASVKSFDAKSRAFARAFGALGESVLIKREADFTKMTDDAAIEFLRSEFEKDAEINSDGTPKDGVTSVIIQMPVRDALRNIVKEFLPKEKDIDSLTGMGEFGEICATAQACLDLYDMLDPEKSKGVVLIGCKGFVGKGIERGLRERNLIPGENLKRFDVQEMKSSSPEDKDIITDLDELERLKNEGYLIMFCAASNPDIIDAEYLSEYSRVIDTAFIPKTNDDATVALYSNVPDKNRSIPEFITRVPGGVGPLEMCILLIRFFKMVTGIDLDIKEIWRNPQTNKNS